MHQIINSNDVRIMRNTVGNELIVGKTRQPDGSLLTVEVRYKGNIIREWQFNPCIPLREPILNRPIMECSIRVSDSRGKALAEAAANPKLGDQLVYEQIGWMKCVACSDQKIKPGKMWLGKNPDGTDIWCVCVECGGSCEVPRYKILDAQTHEEIDYEMPSPVLAGALIL